MKKEDKIAKKKIRKKITKLQIWCMIKLSHKRNFKKKKAKKDVTN